MPEVDAVAPLADPAQRSDPERLTDPESGMRDRRDQNGEAERGCEVAALVQRRVEVLHLQEEEDGADERRDAEQLEHRQCAPPEPLDPRPDEREQDPHQQQEGARIGAVVDARGIGRVGVENPHQRRRGGDAGDHEHRQPLAADEDEARHEEQRPDDVELLLHPERPRVLQERRVAHQVEVRVVRDDLVPVRVVEERADHVAARAREVLAREDRREDERPEARPRRARGGGVLRAAARIGADRSGSAPPTRRAAAT